MKTYSIELIKRVISRATIEIEAENLGVAMEMAHDTINPNDFEEEDNFTEAVHAVILSESD